VAGSVTEFVVFMASPSDLTEEREAVRAVVDETNALLANFDIRFRVAGWENTLPDAGRPQGLINPGVERCDIFIGLLKHRWGSPTGLYSSGFEEEYTLAQARHDDGGLPTIHLFFGDVPDNLLEDPGVSLQQVLAFKEKITSERRALYRRFQDRHDLVRQVQSVLVAKALARSDATAREDAVGSSAAEELPPDTIATVELDEAREQMSSTVRAFDTIIRGEATGSVHYDQDRLELIARAFSRDKEEIGSHLANRLFRRRSELSLSVGEAELWLRSLLADVGRHEAPSRTIPGWGVLGDPNGEIGKLVKLATSDERAVAIGALRAMRERGLRPGALFGGADGEFQAEDDLSEIVDTWVKVLNADPGTSEALDYLLASFGPSARLTGEVAEAEHLDGHTAPLLTDARAAVAGRPQQLASEFGVIHASRPDNFELRRILTQQLEALSDVHLSQLLRRASGPDLHLPALKIALQRGILTAEECEKVIKWDDPGQDDTEQVDALVEIATDHPAAAAVLLGGKNGVKSRRLRTALMARTFPVDDLRTAHRQKPWDTDSWISVLLVGGSEELTEARELLDTEAASLRERLGSELKGRDDLVEFIVGEHLAAAGIFLARRLGDAEAVADSEQRTHDLQRIIQAARLSHRLERTKFIVELADVVNIDSEADMVILKPWLRGFAADLYVSEWDTLLDTPLAPVAAEIAVASENETLRDKGLAWVAAQRSTRDEQLLDYIYNERSEVRVAAVSNLIERWEPPRLTQLLDTYADSERPYWYNVITALDDHLHT
jgi:hypothetical protein